MGVLRGPITEQGAVAEVLIGPSQLARESVALDDLPLARIKVKALFDTGADSSLVHMGLASRIGIAAHSVVSVVGVHGHEVLCSVYDVDLDFGQGVALHDLSVVETTIRSLGDDIGLLIGRSALWRGVFTYHGLAAPHPYFEFAVPG